MNPITGGPAGEWPTRPRVLDADPDTPTADAPADTDLREQIARWLSERVEITLFAADYAAKVLLPLVRAQVEAARRDARDAVTVITRLTDIPLDGQVSLNDVVEAFDRVARGETRQP